MTPIIVRRSFDKTPLERQLSRVHEVKKVLDLIDTAVKDRPRGRKRLFFFQGEAGVGKSWLLDNLQAELRNLHPEWQISEVCNANEFLEDPPYSKLAAVMDWCAGEELLVLSQAAFDPNAMVRRANLLHNRLLPRAGQTLVLLFDELEAWVDPPAERQACKTNALGYLWKILLQRSDMPCLIVCAGRQMPLLGDPFFTRITEEINVSGFPAAELQRLIEYSDQVQIQPVIESYAQSNPLVAQLFDYHLAQRGIPGNAFAHHPQRLDIINAVFDAVVAGRLDKPLRDVLFQLADQRRNGFYDDDALLPAGQGPSTVNKLIQASFVRFQKPRWYVLPPLAGLFVKEQQ